jgi:hypothetical protein
MLDLDSLDEALRVLGELLEDRGLPFDLALIGGGALLLVGAIDRPTKDLDVVAIINSDALIRAEPFPAPLTAAVEDVAGALGLPRDWLNPGPAALLDLGLPAGFLDRAEVRRYGALTVRLASRIDQVAFKLYAAVDQGPQSKHFADLLKLEPTPQELLDSGRWCRTHDPSEGFRAMLVQALAALGVDDPDV